MFVALLLGVCLCVVDCVLLDGLKWFVCLFGLVLCYVNGVVHCYLRVGCWHVLYELTLLLLVLLFAVVVLVGCVLVFDFIICTRVAFCL